MSDEDMPSSGKRTVRLLEAIEANAASLAAIGLDAVEEAKIAGTTCSFEDPEREGVIVRVHPDGTREVVNVPNGSYRETPVEPDL